jgi:hypothetical protein
VTSAGFVRFLALSILVVLGLSIVGMIAYARGPKHHRGDEVGTHGTKPAAVHIVP